MDGNCGLNGVSDAKMDDNGGSRKVRGRPLGREAKCGAADRCLSGVVTSIRRDKGMERQMKNERQKTKTKD